VAWYPTRTFADVEPASVSVAVNDLDAFAFEADELRCEIYRTAFFCFVEVLSSGFDRAAKVGKPAWGSDVSEFWERGLYAALLQPPCDCRRLLKRMLETETGEPTPSSPEIKRNEIQTPVEIDRDLAFHLFGICSKGRF